MIPNVNEHQARRYILRGSQSRDRQIRTLDKRRLKEKMGHLDPAMMTRVNNAIAVSFGLGELLTLSPDTSSDPTPSQAVATVAPPTGENRNGGVTG